MTKTQDLIANIRTSIETLLSIKQQDEEDANKYVSRLTMEDFPADAASL